MKLQEAVLHCEKAWNQFAKKNKIQEELGELTRTFMELHGRERASKPTQEELKKKFSGDIASLVWNSLILAYHFDVDLETVLKEKFPV